MHMKKQSVELSWALIFAAVSLLWMILERLAGLHDTNIHKHAVFTNLFAIPAVAVYVFALLYKRKFSYNGIMSYRQGLVSGIIITAFVVLFSPLVQLISLQLISPEYLQNMADYAVSSGTMSAAESAGYFSLKSYVLQSLAGAAIMGVLTSLIVALFTRRRAR
jgi:hypothetical protein